LLLIDMLIKIMHLQK